MPAVAPGTAIAGATLAIQNSKLFESAARRFARLRETQCHNNHDRHLPSGPQGGSARHFSTH
jgi:hypothetical protein